MGHLLLLRTTRSPAEICHFLQIRITRHYHQHLFPIITLVSKLHDTAVPKIHIIISMRSHFGGFSRNTPKELQNHLTALARSA